LAKVWWLPFWDTVYIVSRRWSDH